jgi:hypothetical protein
VCNKGFISGWSWALWLLSVILATQEAEIRRITIQSLSGQIKTLHKNRAGGVAQGEGPEFKPQYRKQNKKPGRFITGWATLI